MVEQERSARSQHGNGLESGADIQRGQSGAQSKAPREQLETRSHQDVKYDFAADLTRIGERSVHEMSAFV